VTCMVISGHNSWKRLFKYFLLYFFLFRLKLKLPILKY
jgi:hypothetical protein